MSDLSLGLQLGYWGAAPPAHLVGIGPGAGRPGAVALGLLS